MKYDEDDVRFLAKSLLDIAEVEVVWDSYSCPLCNNKVAIRKSNFERAMNDIAHSSHCAYVIAQNIIN